MIAFSGAFHGRTIMGMALTGKVAPYKLSFGPMPGDVYHVPFPNGTQDITVADSLKALDLLFKVDIDPSASPPSSSNPCRAKAASTSPRRN